MNLVSKVNCFFNQKEETDSIVLQKLSQERKTSKADNKNSDLVQYSECTETIESCLYFFQPFIPLFLLLILARIVFFL